MPSAPCLDPDRPGAPPPEAEGEVHRPVVGRRPHRRQVHEPVRVEGPHEVDGFAARAPQTQVHGRHLVDPLALSPGSDLRPVAAGRHRAPPPRVVLRAVVEDRPARLVGAQLQVVEAPVERADERDRDDPAERRRDARPLRLEGGVLRGVEVGMQARREPDAVDRLGVLDGDRLVVAGQDQVADRIAQAEVRLTVGVGEAFVLLKQVPLNEEGVDLLRRRLQMRALGVVHVEVHEPLQQLEVSRSRNGVAMGSRVERHHDRECTPSKSVDKLH